MDTKLKNRYVYGLLFLISIYMLGVAMLSGFDFINNKEFAQKNSYFKSYSFKAELREYSESVQILTIEQKSVSQKYKDKSAGIENYLVDRGVKSKVDSEKSLRYYLKDKSSGEIYTNIENLSNIEDYINKEAIYVEKFPSASGNEGELKNINSWFQNNNFQGSFIFIKTTDVFNQMVDNYKYYNSIRERIMKEVILGSILLVVGVLLLIFLKLKFSAKNKDVNIIEQWYEKIPLDSRGLIFIVYSISMLVYLDETTFFYKPLGVRHFLKLTTVAVFIFYLIVNFRSVLKLLRSKEELSAQLRRSIVYQIIILIKESLKIEGTMAREVSLFVSTALFGISFIVALLGVLYGNKFVLFFSFMYIVVYLMVVPIYILKRAAVLNKIISGTDAIASGNLDYFIDETGDRNFIKISRNINSMKESFKKSVESQLKSERLKTELITNVSHDLKTPLTSIISYVSLLKKGGLSEEQSKRYIEVLDSKSQRLKVLIEDLFEASKVSSGAVELNIEEVDIASLLRQALGEFDEKINSSFLTFRTNIPVEEVNLNLDGKRTWRVFENLISNVLKYSQPNSRVYIDLFEQAEKVVIIMKNMSAYELDFDVDEIFERFKRGDKARSTEGSGLGLSIAKSIVELQGGKMGIDIDGDLFKVIVEFKK